MRRLLAAVACDARLQYRNGFYAAAGFVAVALVLLLRLVPDPYVGWLMPMLVLMLVILLQQRQLRQIFPVAGNGREYFRLIGLAVAGVMAMAVPVSVFEVQGQKLLDLSLSGAALLALMIMLVLGRDVWRRDQFCTMMLLMLGTIAAAVLSWFPVAGAWALLPALIVVRRGVERTRPLPERSSAVRATSRLKAPLTAPSARPIADVASGTPRLTPRLNCSRSVARGSVLPCEPPRRPPTVPWFGNASDVVFPTSGITRPFNPHCTPIALAKSRVV